MDPGSLATKAPPTLGHARLYPGAPTAKKWLAETYALNLPSNLQASAGDLPTACIFGMMQVVVRSEVGLL